MADNDPRFAALQNVQDQSRAYARSRRRGGDADADVDPAFRAALEIEDPQARREALAQYARERANALFSPDSARGRASDLVRDAFPGGMNMQAPAMPRQADVMPRAPQSPRMQAAEDKQAVEADALYDLMQRYGSSEDMERYQAPGLPGAEDSPEAHQALMQRGRDILAPSRAAIDAEYADAAFDAADDRGIEGREKGQMTTTPRPENVILARRRR